MVQLKKKKKDRKCNFRQDDWRMPCWADDIGGKTWSRWGRELALQGGVWGPQLQLAGRGADRSWVGGSVAEQSEAEKACKREGPRVRISGDIRFLPQMSCELLEDFQKKNSAIWYGHFSRPVKYISACTVRPSEHKWLCLYNTSSPPFSILKANIFMLWYFFIFALINWGAIKFCLQAKEILHLICGELSTDSDIRSVLTPLCY